MARITDLIREATGGDRLGKAGAVQEFADSVGTTSSTVSRWRQGIIPGPQWRGPLAEALGMSEDDVEDACRDGDTVTLETLDAKMDRILALLEGRRRK